MRVTLACRTLFASVVIAALLVGCAAPAAPSPTVAPTAAPAAKPTTAPAAPAAAAPTTAPAATAAPAAAPTKPAAASAEPFKFGGIFAITGAASSLGIPERDTALMLADDLNKKGGIGGRKVDVVIYDNRSDDTEAVKVAKRLIDEDKVSAIVGPSRSGDTLAIIDTVEKAAVPLVSASAAVQIVEPVKKWVFKTPQSDRHALLTIVDYLKTKNLTKVAFVHETTAFGEGGKAEMTKIAPGAGLSIVATESYGDKDAGMTAQLTKIKATDAQVIIAWGTSQSSATVQKGAAQLGIKTPIIHSHGIANQTYIDLAGDTANGTIFPVGKLPVASTLPDSDPQKKVLLDYAGAYKARYNKDADTFGGHAWDALQLVFKAVEKVGADRAKIRDEIEATKNFIGISGVFNFSATDHNGLGKDAMTMVEIKDKKWVALK